MIVYLVAKRIFDFVGSLVALILLAPIMCGVSLAILLGMGRPVLFRQLRIGKNAKLFTVYKFRTMTDARGPDGQYLPDSDRLLPIGRFIRTTSLDELPQLWNVLLGNMSFVGPRPLLPEYLPRYNARQARRHEVTPGITGWAQINGRNALGWKERFELDVWYVEQRSFLLDMSIFVKTVFKAVHREGISQAGEATMQKFMGNESE